MALFAVRKPETQDREFPVLIVTSTLTGVLRIAAVAVIQGAEITITIAPQFFKDRESDIREILAEFLKLKTPDEYYALRKYAETEATDA